MLAAGVVAATVLTLVAGVPRAAPYASGIIERPAAAGPGVPPGSSSGEAGPAPVPAGPAAPSSGGLDAARGAVLGGQSADPAARGPRSEPNPGQALGGTPPRAVHARLALVIDDLGAHAGVAQRVLALPGPVACAVLPGTASAAAIARAARAAGREVLVHLPMRAPRGSVGSPYLLDVGMHEAAIAAVLARALAAVPGAVGVNNHQGSTLTAQAVPMAALMRALAGTELWFLDSRTTPATVAAREAERAGVPVLERQVFLDNDPDAAAVHVQFGRAVALARRHGQALAIGHPHPATLAVLAERLPRLREAGVELVAPSALLGARRPSHSPDVAATGH